MQREVHLHAIELGQATFGKAPKCFDAVDVSPAFGERLFLVDADVLVEAYVDESIVTGPAVRADDAGGINAATDHRPQRGLGAIFDDFGVNFSLAFEDAENRLFEGSPTSQPGQSTSPYPAGTEVAFIDFDHAAKLPALIHSLPGDEQAEALVEGVEGLAVEPQKRRRLSGGKVQRKALHRSSDFVFA